MRAFLDHVAAHRLDAAFLLLITSGMRRGKALGLRWSDLDLQPAIDRADGAGGGTRTPTPEGTRT
jgi:integrase